ncbi:MAG: RHS repeat-associated core domain-containing protein [Phycisphaerae bacterium]
MRTAESTATVFRKAVYSYYTGTYTGADAYGNQGDLQSVKIEDGVGNVINETHYRYYTQTEIDSGSAGFVGALKYVVLPDNFAKLAAVVGDPLAAADNRVADYADNYFEYDEQGRVTTERAATAGASSTGGEGTSTLEYKQNPNFPSSGAANFNTWWMRSTETLPDGTQHLVYTNVNKDALLTITVDNANTIVSMLAYQYDSFGRKITTINPSAMNVGYYDLGTLSYETANDVGITEGGAHNTIGLVNTRTFYPADSTGAGSAPGYLEADYIKQGITGTSVKQDFYTYSADTDANGNTIYNPATYTVYRSTDGSGAETTTFSYVYSNTHQLLEMESSAPLVSGDQHGPDSADVTAVYYDSYGRPIWTKDAEEHINYFAYDTATGAVVTMIQDLDYNKLSETLQQLFDNGPHALASEWSQPFDGLHLVTSYEVDSFGRTIKETSPNNNVTYTVYDDANHAVFILPGAINGTGTLTTTGPITMVRARIPYTYQSGTLAGTYDESVTFSGTVTITDGKIDSSNFTFIHGNDATSGEFNVLNLFGNGTSSPQFVIQLLSRTLYNISGQAIERDAYANINNANYLGTNPNTPYSGSPINPSDGTGSYAATHYGYDLNGRWYQTTNANGTITDTVYDTLSRVTSTWVGTNDTTIDGLPFIGLNGGTGDNMTEVFAYAYDGGNVGDSDLTQSTQFVDSNSAHDRITDYLYDWRNRLVASRQADGIGYSITYRNLDNLGEATSTFAFEGSAIALSDFPTDGITIITDGGGHSVASVDPSALRRYSTAAYDDQGRVYSTATYSVEPDTGYLTVNPVTSTITPLTSAVWYDHRGNVIETQTSGSAATKIKYDGAGRMTVTYTTDGGAVNNSGAPLMSWDAAGDVSNDVVLEQVEYLYDADSNIIETIDRQRFHDETGTDALGDPSSATQPKARVYYTLAYYDAANRLTASVNVGTNGGVLTDFNDGLDLSTDDNTDGTPDILQNGIPGSYNPDTVLVTSYTYNVAGWVNTVTDPRGIVSKTFYDNLGRTLYSVAAWAGVYDPTQGELPSSGSQNQTTKYTYDGDGHILTMTAVMPSTQNSQTTQYTYGVSPVDGSKISSNDLLRLVAYPDKDTGEASNDDSARNHFTYNAAGQVLTKTDQNGTKHTYTYDVLGRQTKDEIAVAEGNPHLVDQGVVRIETSYDSQGNVYQITSYNAATEYNIVNRIQREYNGLGQLIREYQSTSGPVNGTTPQVRYAYSSPDTGSRIVSMTYPNGRILHYGYDGSALDTAIGRLSYLADDDGGDVGQPLEEYTYLGLSTVVQLAHPEVGTKLTYTSSDSHANYDGGDPYTGLDRFGRVIDQNTITVSTGVSTDRFQYGYDRNGNVLYKNNIVNLADSELYHANSANSGDDNSAYDPLNRLTGFIRGELSASGNNGGSLDKVLTANRSQSWNLDALGNMNTITTDTSTETRTYNSQNEITSLGTDAYDNNGNTIKDDQGHHLVYDAWNRLVRVLNADNTTVRASYTYDGMRRRVTETYPATSTTNNLYYSSQWQVLEERQNGTDNSNVSQQYVWSPTYVDAMVLRDSFSSGVFTQRLYVQYDANYNVTALIDGTPLSENLGQPVERYIYDSYGKVTVLDAGTCSQKGGGTVAASGFGWRYLHQGGRFDAATGLYNFRNRDYSPTLQRWMQQEPYGAAYIDGMNLYQSYVANPINRLDPHGTDEQSATGKAITKEAIKQSIEYLQSQPGEVGRLGQLAGNTNNVIQDANRIQKVAGALYDLGTAIGTNDPEERKAALNRAAKYVGEEEVKSIMKSLAVKLGEDIGLGAGAGAIYAAVLIDAMKTGDAIGQKAANMLDDAFVQNVYTNAQNNPQLVRGSMIYQQGSGRFGLYVFVDNNGQIWVRRPVVHSGLYILVWGMWHCPDFEWVHP